MSDIFARIQQDITDNAVVVYMKGTAQFPHCGFSSVVVQILKKLDVPFKDINILEDHELRQAIKEFSDWPTIPQVYINQEFIGGCDIMKELYQNGELETLLREKKIIA